MGCNIEVSGELPLRGSDPWVATVTREEHSRDQDGDQEDRGSESIDEAWEISKYLAMVNLSRSSEGRHSQNLTLLVECPIKLNRGIKPNQPLGQSIGSLALNAGFSSN
jgi:hypothetical protein